MNRKSLIALAIVAASGAAFADGYPVETTPFVSTLTRAEVQAELARFIREGGVIAASDWYAPIVQTSSQRTRAEVRAEYIEHRDRVGALSGEDSGSAYREN